MKSRAKEAAAAPKARAPLGLERFLPIKDVRKLVWLHLDQHDREMVRCAQNSKRVPRLQRWSFVLSCAKRGYLELLQWARGQPGVADEVLSRGSVSAAAGGGRIEVLQWLLANGVRLDEGACEWAARGGHIETLVWLRATSVPWRERACAWAADTGQLECLKWLRANGAPWDSYALCFARLNNRTKVVEWLVANGAPQ